MELFLPMLIATAKCWNLPQVTKIMVTLSCINVTLNDGQILSLVESEDAMGWNGGRKQTMGTCIIQQLTVSTYTQYIRTKQERTNNSRKYVVRMRAKRHSFYPGLVFDSTGSNRLYHYNLVRTRLRNIQIFSSNLSNVVAQLNDICKMFFTQRIFLESTESCECQRIFLTLKIFFPEILFDCATTILK